MSSIRLQVIGYGHTTCGPQWAVNTSGEMFQRIYYVLDGSCTCTLDGRSFVLQKEHLYIMPQHVPYSMTHDPDDPLSVLWQHIYLRDSNTGPHMICRNIKPDSATWHVLCALRELTKGMLVEQVNQQDNALARQVSYLVEALLMLLDHEQPLLSALDARLTQCIHLVTEHPNTFYTVQDLAEYVKLERSYFSRLFQDELRISAQTFLIRHRLERAADALLRGCCVSDAAEIAGYSDPKSFSRAFSNQYGITAAQYKKYHVLQP